MTVAWEQWRAEFGGDCMSLRLFSRKKVNNFTPWLRRLRVQPSLAAIPSSVEKGRVAKRLT